MPWRCFLVERSEEMRDLGNGVRQRIYKDAEGQEYLHEELPIGAVWYVPDSDLWAKRYKALAGLDDRIAFIKLPGNNVWCMDGTGSDGGRWLRCGTIPSSLTMYPSINFVGSYHGWVREGQVSEDVEGRKF